MSLDHAKAIADAVLYEGYILYPYRASAIKNQQRFNFGVLMPHSYSEEQKGTEAWTMRTECLIEGDQPTIDVRVRFLHLVSREVLQKLQGNGADLAGEGAYQRVPSLKVGEQVYHTWQEAIEREVNVESLAVPLLVSQPHHIEIGFPTTAEDESLRHADGAQAGRLVRRQGAIQGTITISAQAVGEGVHRITVEIANTTSIDGDAGSREDVLLHAFASAHTILGARSGEFVSLLDPPEPLAETVAACQNVGTWPVLVGDEGDRDLMLSSPIILYDYPQIAPESVGDFFDGAEIDEMLALRVMTLTDDEKREMMDVDDRARKILERTEALPQEQWQKMHGAIRGLKTTPSQ